MANFPPLTRAYACGQTWAGQFAGDDELEVVKDFAEKCDGDINLLLSAMSTMNKSMSPEAIARVRGAWEILQDLVGVCDGEEDAPTEWLRTFCLGAAEVAKSNGWRGRAELPLAAVALLREF